VVHSFGPDHIRLMSVSSDRKLLPRTERYTANTAEKAPEKFLLVGTTFDLPIAISGAYPDSSPILWVPGQTANSDLVLRMRGIPMVAIGVEACVSCHGPNGDGEPPTVPYLAGQYKQYIKLQIQMFQKGYRKSALMKDCRARPYGQRC
jgi:Cytochrome c